MAKWSEYVQTVIDQIDACIKNEEDEALTLSELSRRLGYSDYYTSRKFREISGMTLKDYISARRLAFALRDLRDTQDSILSIAVKYGFSSNEAFTHAFRQAYGVTPHEYRKHPAPAALRTVLGPFDCYLTEEAADLREKQNDSGVKTYFVQIPAHKFLHIRNYDSIGYWDFWQRQNQIPGQDQKTVCGILDGVEGKLDDAGGHAEGAGSSQLMAWINEPSGRICSWGIPLAEAYGVRLTSGYEGEAPEPLRLMDVPEGEYLVFEHGPFDPAAESRDVEAKIEAAMKAFDYEGSGYELDLTPERVFYFYYDSERFFKYVRPVRRRRYCSQVPRKQ